MTISCGALSDLRHCQKTEQSKIALKTEELKYRGKEIEANEKLARASLDYQAKLQTDKPQQHRDTIKVYAICGFVILALVLSFIAYLVINGHSAFVEKLMDKVAYVIVSAISFLAGRITKKKNSSSKSDDISDAHVVE